MKRIMTLLLVLAVMLSAFGVDSVMAEDDPQYVNVAAGKFAGGAMTREDAWGLMNSNETGNYVASVVGIDAAANLVDGDPTTGANFSAETTNQGNMYVDLGAEYKIDHIKVLSYNNTMADRSNGYTVVMSNSVRNGYQCPDPNKYEFAQVTDSTICADATTAEYRTFIAPDDAAKYRFVSVEKFVEGSAGLNVAEIEVYVDAEEAEAVTLPEYVDVATGKTTGGAMIDPSTGAAKDVHYSPASMVDGDETTAAGFWENTEISKGYMYVDLGRKHKIDHIEVVAYEQHRPATAGEYDVFVSNNVPSGEADADDRLLVDYANYDSQMTSAANSVRRFYMPAGDNEYRFVSFEKLQESSLGMMIREVKIYVNAEDLPKVVNVSKNKATGGDSFDGIWAGTNINPQNLVDGNEDTCAEFYSNSGTRGYFYVDLGTEYKIDHIEILAYNGTYADRVGDFDLVVSNSVPDEVPASDNPKKTLVTHVGVDHNATSAAVGYKSFSLPDDASDNKYRYVSMEKLYSNGYGLMVQEIRVYVLEEDLPLNLSKAEMMANGNEISMTAELTNGGYEEMILLMKSYDKNGMIKKIATKTIGLPTYVVDELFTLEIDAGSLAEDDLFVDVMAVDSLENMKPVFYVENILNNNRNMLALESSDIGLDFTAGQKGMNAEISGTAPGNRVFATLLYPDSEIAYFGYDETVDGEFNFDIVMPEKAESGEYTAILGIISKDIPAHERTAVFDFVSLVEDFENVTVQNFLETAEKYSDSYPELYALLEERAETIGESFMLAKACFESGKVNEKITALNNSVNITEAMRAALLIDATINSEEFGTAVEEYKDTMPLIFGEDFDNTDSFVKYLNKVKGLAELDSAENIVKAYRKSLALAILAKGTRADIAEVIENYADAMDINLEELEDAGVTANEVAKKISTSDAALERYLKNGMGADVDVAIDSVLDDKSSKKPSGGGSGGGGGGRVSATIYPPPTVPLEVPEKGGNADAEVKEENALYTDIAGYDWAKNAISVLAEKEIMGGIGNGLFAPNQNLTREQAAKLIVLAFDLESTMKTNRFEDCDIDEWYYPYVTAASANGVVKGLNRTEFGVGSFITRQDMAVMLDRALKLKGLASGSSAHSLTDMDSVDDYAKDSVTTLATMGIINGMEDGSFCPHNQITRAEAAVMLSRILDLF